jgi:uncharacterized repeat protein (TIGR01451 family)
VPPRSGSPPLNRKRIALAVAVGLSLFVLPEAALGQGWYGPEWGYRKKITIDHTMVAGDLGDFPVLLGFTDTDLRDKARNDGWDILFTSDNGTTKLDHDFEDYDGATGAIIVWVEVTNLSGSVDTDIYIYYGYPTVPSNQENETGTWSNGYEAVYHLHDNSFADAAGNHNATNSGSANATGIAGDGRNFVRSEGDYIDTGWNPSLTGDFTLEGWFRALGQSGSGDAWGVEDRDGGDNSEIRLAIRDTDTNNEADSYNIEMRADAGAPIISASGALPGDPDDGLWHHIALVRAGSIGRLYYDGAYIALTDSALNSGTSSYPVSLLMGAQWDTQAGAPYGVRNELNGDLDETRVSTVFRTEDYFATQVANINNSAPGGFYDFTGGEETPPSSGIIGLLVAGGTPEVFEDSIKAFLEAQGLTVIFGDGGWTLAQVESFVSANNIDGLFLSPSNGSSSVDPNLTNITTGLVMSNVGNWEDFELAGHDSEDVSGTGNIVDNTHFITQPFATGNITLFSPSSPLGWGDGGFGSGADVLMEYPGQSDRGLIVAYETGSTLETGSAADGRRVGFFLESEVWADYTEDTKTLIYRSLLWAGGLAGSGPTYDVDVTPDGATTTKQAGTDYSQDFTVTNNSSVSEDFDLLAWTDPASSFITVDSITWTGNTAAAPDSGRITGLASSASETISVWYTVASSTDGNVDTLYLKARSVTSPTVADSGWVEVEFDAPAVPTPLGQYWFNEAGSGQGPLQIVDAQASPVNLAINYTAQLHWTGSIPHRGLESDANGHAGRAYATAAGTKYSANLDNSTQATFVAVGRYVNTAGQQPNMVGFEGGLFNIPVVMIITNQAGGAFGIGLTTKSQMALAVAWPGTWNDDQRYVYTFVYDSQHGTANRRIRLYVDGVDQGPGILIVGSWPAQNEALNFAAGDLTLQVLNTENGTLALDGAVHYYAVYDQMLSDAQIAASATSLLADDDNLGAPLSISSASNQTFTVGDPVTTAATITITDNALTPTITDADDIRIRIPSGFNMTWDNSVGSVTIGGAAASKVSGTVQAYEDGDKTVVLNVTSDFAAGDQITVDDLAFTSFTAVSAADNLELEVENDGNAQAYDDKTIEIQPAPATLLGRYWFNEAPSGQSPDTVYDDQASPVNLAITYDTGVEWVVTDGHRGLNGPNGTHVGVAQGDATGTKYQTSLDGASQASFTVVTEWTNSGETQAIAGFYTSAGTRVMHFGTLSNGALDVWIRTESQSDLRVRWGDTGWADGTRRVFHLLYDSDDPTPENRVRLYVDGVDQGAGTLGSGSWPASGEALDLSGSISIAALNEAGGVQDATQGTVFYYAVYDGALTGSEISSDATALLADDDNITPAVSVSPDGLGAPVLRQPGTDYSYDFTVKNTSSVLDDYDLLASTDPTSSFLSVDSITGTDVSQGAQPDSARVTGIAAGDSAIVSVWYTVASDTDGNVDSLYLAARSVSDTSASDDGFIEVEYDEPPLTPLVRYWIDEAPSGQGVAQLIDSEASPINMPLGYVGSSPVWNGDHGGFRNLRFYGTDGSDTGGGVVDVNGTKLDALHGATRVTLEVKYMMDGGGTCGGNDPRIFGISDGDVSLSGWLAIRERNLRDVLQVQWQGQDLGIYALETGCPISSASVVHWVIDTTEPVAADRIRAYIDGVQATVTAIDGSSLPAQNETVDLGAGTRRMFVGRAHSGVRTFRGRIWYAAIYQGEMTGAQITSNASALNSSDDNNTYAVTVTPDGATVVRQTGSYSFDFTLNNGSSVLEDFDLLASTGPASSFITIDSITGGGVTQGATPDSAEINGVDAGADSSVTVWYSVAASTDGRIDTLYLAATSVSDTAQSDLGWLEIEYETISVTVAPDGVDTLQVLPTGSAASSSYKFTITNNSAVSETFDLLAFPGDTLDTVLTVDSITGPNVSGGAPGDSARTGTIAASADDSAFVWFTVAVGTSGALDSLYLMGRSVSEPSATDSGWVFIELLQPDLTTSKSVNPNGTQPPGTDLTYTATVTNNGTADAVNVVTVDSLAAEVYFQVGSVVTNLPTGMTDNLEYYDGCGSDGWSYVPVSGGGGAPAGYDACVIRIRWTLLDDLSYVAPDNTADLEFVARIK